MKVEIMPAALADLAAVRWRISLDSPRGADRMALRLVQACETLSTLPFRGRPGKLANTRELTAVWPYVISYRITPERVEVLRIWHGAQDRR